MAFDPHANFALSTVATPPSPATSGTSLTVQTGDGAKFPAVSFNAVVCPPNTTPTTANAEIVRVTNISTDTFTVTRTQESTNARSIAAGDQIYNAPTTKVFTDIENQAALLASSNIFTGNAQYIAPASGATYLIIDPPASTQGTILFQDAGTSEWQLGMDAGQNFFLYDAIANVTTLSITTGNGPNFHYPLTSPNTWAATTQSGDYSAHAGDLVLMTGAHTVTLPSAPFTYSRVKVVALTANVTVNRGGSDTITNYASTTLTTFTVTSGTSWDGIYAAGVWYKHN